jgi:hypothetical protein
MHIGLLKTAVFLAEVFEHDKLLPFNSDHMDFGEDYDQGFMLHTMRGLVVVGTNEDETSINVLVIHLGTGDKRDWKDFDDVYMHEEILDWLDRKDKFSGRQNAEDKKRLPPMCTLMKM